ncbi:MAG TPA: Holliday junction ATP-dependent DNA helicase RuvA [Kofleriaceae bacterium]|nr:Holliday junction ATP-dependent DNA helicase RuvA [Kofleriaceae bacterium]
MIARLAGTLVDRDGTEIIIDCGGVGYEVTCSAYTLAALPAIGERVVLKVFTHALESKLTLYGFIDAAERSLFDLLIKVKNVGPSTATSILSGSAPRDIATLIAREDLHGLTRIKGVGKKTGEMLIVELREKCEMLLLTWTADGGVRTVAQPAGAIRATIAGRRHPLLEEVAGALAAMGWRPIEADAAVADLPVTDDATLESLLRQALRNMPR